MDEVDKLAKENKKATLEECLMYVTSIIRKSEFEYQDNEKWVSLGLKACEMMLKHYPGYEGGANIEQDKYSFARERKSV